MRAVAQQFYEKRPGMDATANGGAAEGVAMEGNDRSGKTCSSRFKRLSTLGSLFFLPNGDLRKGMNLHVLKRNERQKKYEQ